MMDEHTIDRIEAKIKNLEKQVQRLQRKSRKVATGFITPYPISVAVSGENIQGDILNCMFPCKGIITKGAIRLDNRPKGTVSVGIRLFNTHSQFTDETILEKQLTIIEPNLEVLPWDCLKITLNADSENPVTRIWVSLLWVPHISDITAMSFLLDKIEEAAKL